MRATHIPDSDITFPLRFDISRDNPARRESSTCTT